MFGRKKESNIPVKEIIPENIQICTLYSFEKNKFGTELLTSTILCNEGDGYSFDHKETHFSIINVNWKGKKTRTYSNSTNTSVSTGDSKRKGRVLGAAIGTAIAPGIGTVIGAAYGTGNKKTKVNTVSHANTIETELELFSNISVTLKYIDGTISDKLYRCLEKDAQKIISLVETDDVTYRKEKLWQ